MRRAVTAALVSLAVLAGSAAMAPSASAVVIDDTSFGMHVPNVSTGGDPSVNYGAIRLWDSGVSWGLVQQTAKKYWWNGLDASIANANKQGASILYVLGSTPKWAAKNPKQGTYPNKGAASMPSSSKLWKDWVTSVVKRYRASIDAYQIWNEANLSTFWQGTPDEMADLTKQAYTIIRKYDPTAKVVAASSTVRLTSAFNKFFPDYLKGLKKRGWPVDVFSAHLYPAGTGTPATRAGYITTVKAALAKAGAPARPLWDTEINYGLAGPGSVPHVTIVGDDAAAYVSQTYLDDVRLGVQRAYWYYWYAPSTLLGINMIDGSAPAIGYQYTYNWLVGGDVNCSTAAVNICSINKAGVIATVAWATTGSGTFTVPAGATVQTTAAGVTTPVVAGTPVTIGNMPTWFGAAS